MSEADGITERVIADQQQLYQALVGRYLSNADGGRHEDNDSLVYELRRWKQRQQEQQ